MIVESLEPKKRVSSVGALLVFFALAFALLWICFSIVAFVPISAGSLLGGDLLLLGAFAPALAALAITFRADGRGRRYRAPS